MNPRKIRQLTVEEIHQMVELYARSCARAKKSGFDGVEIHAHGGYLLSEFLSPFYNNRTDEYGGTFENRTRVLFEIIEKDQAYCGANYPIIVRFAADEGIGDKGRQLGESIELAKLLEKALADGKADFISIGRGLVCEPYWINKIKKNDMKDFRRCVSCNYCHGERIMNSHTIRCAFNPLVGREWKYMDGIKEAPHKKNVAIIGAGPAGLEAARTAALRGHYVDLYDKANGIGEG